MFYKIDDDSDNTDKRLLGKITEEVKKVFPIEGNIYTLEAKNITPVKKDVDITEVKDAIFKRKSITNEIRGDLTLIRNSDKKVIDRKSNVVIAKVPQFTKKDTFVVEGNSYVVPNQQRLKAGAYLFERKNGEVVTIINSVGNRQFKITLNPDTGVFYINIGNSNVPLYSILKALDVPDAEIKKNFGDKLYEVNKAKSSPNDLEKFIKKSYSLPEDIEKKSDLEKVKYLFEHMELDPDVTHRNFGVSTNKVSPSFIFNSVKKILEVYNGKKVDL
jgi:DNA-directed RNA polymerase beta subunit